MTDLPIPPVPADCDLTDFRFMPLDVARLRDSDLASNETPDACWAAVLLWAASWHQVPASSIPDDDRWIAKTAGYAQRGRIDKDWARVREGALRGFIKCTDGRLYHPVVAEKAREAWEAKLRTIRLLAIDAAKKAARRVAMPAWLDLEQRRQVRAFYEQSARISAETGIPHNVDHIVPINGETVCGLHVPWNLRVIPAAENVIKSNTMDESHGVAA